MKIYFKYYLYDIYMLYVYWYFVFSVYRFICLNEENKYLYFKLN